MAKEEPAQTEVEAGGNKKLIIIIAAAVGVAIILGFALYMGLGKGNKKGAKEGETPPAAAAGAAATHGGATAAGGASSNIFQLEPFVVNIYDGQELRYLKVKIELDMVAPTVKPEIEARLAPIRDAVLVLLSAKTLQEIQDVQGKNALKEEILTAINRHIPPGKLAKVYFTDFVVQ